MYNRFLGPSFTSNPMVIKGNKKEIFLNVSQRPNFVNRMPQRLNLNQVRSVLSSSQSSQKRTTNLHKRHQNHPISVERTWFGKGFILGNQFNIEENKTSQIKKMIGPKTFNRKGKKPLKATL